MKTFTVNYAIIENGRAIVHTNSGVTFITSLVEYVKKIDDKIYLTTQNSVYELLSMPSLYQNMLLSFEK